MAGVPNWLTSLPIKDLRNDLDKEQMLFVLGISGIYLS